MNTFMRDVKKRFGLVLRKWRCRAGISKEELAWRADLHRTYIAGIERRARNASLQTMAKLAKALKTSLSKLFEPLGACPPDATNCVETEEQNETT
jgi:transcriptional regulator with XRE-family HTH domain